MRLSPKPLAGPQSNSCLHLCVCGGYVSVELQDSQSTFEPPAMLHQLVLRSGGLENPLFEQPLYATTMHLRPKRGSWKIDDLFRPMLVQQELPDTTSARARLSFSIPKLFATDTAESPDFERSASGRSNISTFPLEFLAELLSFSTTTFRSSWQLARRPIFNQRARFDDAHSHTAGRSSQRYTIPSCKGLLYARTDAHTNPLLHKDVANC